VDHIRQAAPRLAERSNDMSLGLLMLGDQPAARLAERARFAEACGFDAVWLADERFYREVYSVLALLAQATHRVQLGPCVTDPFARHPALTAMAIATLDEICDGRAALGIGAGVSGFAELGIRPYRPPRAIRESIALIRSLLRGEQVDFTGEAIAFHDGRLSFMPRRADIPIYVASNGPLGQQAAGAIADGAIMEACGSVAEAMALRAEVERGATAAGRDVGAVRVVARLNACICSDGRRARDIVRPSVARYLGRGTLRLATAAAQGLLLPAEATAPMANAPYAAGVSPYLPLLPLITDRHVDSLTLAGTPDEVAAHVSELLKAGIDAVIIRPIAGDGVSAEDTIAAFGAIWSAIMQTTTVEFGG
jgi:5,10-methylenetetrahydromethanopterin reductase